MSEEEKINKQEPQPDEQQANTEAGSSLDPIPETAQHSIINPQLSTDETMEVHHHPHTKRKKFKHYLFEFFMLFLAVFCGFLAENVREHQVEKKREKKYIESMIVDLKKDTVETKSVIDDNLNRVYGMDSMALLLSKPELFAADEKQIYIFNNKFASNLNLMQWNDATFRQLLSSGNLRLKRQQEISDSIMNYYGQPKDNIRG
ncbi:MAG: hypothetical protein KF741_11995 [Ferruginibacter sp.]|nr:hypothetical protein [Bacteroidota bacterium]MBX2919956.1 hypothetical protein [Ferruginibacter sp.]MCB0710588.1 hypothetical protein [Chitinophagaceae bacterium]